MNSSPVLFSALSVITFTTVALADRLIFQEGDGGAYSSSASTTITEGPNLGSSIVLTVVTGDVETLIRFPDILGINPGQIPPGSTIHAASLSVTMYLQQAILGGNPEVHRVYVPWDEYTVTGTSFHALPEPQFGPSVAQIRGDDPLVEVSASVTATVQEWAQGEPNWGFILQIPPPSTIEEGFTGVQYFSDDATTAMYRPRLTVEFTPAKVAVESTTWGRVKALYQ